jgi:hypothetical protein
MQTFVMMGDVPAKIRTEHLPNTGLECYQDTTPFGEELTICSGYHMKPRKRKTHVVRIATHVAFSNQDISK